MNRNTDIHHGTSDSPAAAPATRRPGHLRHGGKRRLLWAAVAAVAVLAVLIWLGPSQEEVKRRFEFYGAPDDELRIMPEISIDEGQDRVHQLPKSLQTPPPPSHIEIEDTPTDGEEPVPHPNQTEQKLDIDTDNTRHEAEDLSEEQVQLLLPLQSNPDWYIIKLVRPEYPLDAPEHDRRTPIIFVTAEIFVGPDGLVAAALVKNTNGSQVYSDAVLEAVQQWQFGWKVDPGLGRWMVLPWNFRSPYFRPDRAVGRP